MEFVDELSKRFSEKSNEIENWLRERCEKSLIPLYTSVDLRISRQKITPVDTNVFPAGFNNLSGVFRKCTAQLFRRYFSLKYPKLKNILLIPELNTKNRYYWENVKVLRSILCDVGFNVEVGIVSDELFKEELGFQTVSGESIRAFKAQKKGYKVVIPNYVPDLILLNNDFSSKCPGTLRDVLQPIEPPVEIGWHSRRKDVHFDFYNRLADEVAVITGIDPRIISIETRSVKGVDFNNDDDRGRVAEKVDSMLEFLRREYKERDVEDQPFVFVKSNSGTYGMAVLSVFNGDKLRTLNSEGRKRMKVTKGGIPVRDIVIQEGIPTALRIEDNTVAEPVIYLVNAQVAGGFLRVNKGKSKFENLNTRGMDFLSVGTDGNRFTQDEECRNAFPLAYQIVARVATLAAAYEIEKIIEEGGCQDENQKN